MPPRKPRRVEGLDSTSFVTCFSFLCLQRDVHSIGRSDPESAEKAWTPVFRGNCECGITVWWRKSSLSLSPTNEDNDSVSLSPVLPVAARGGGRDGGQPGWPRPVGVVVGRTGPPRIHRRVQLEEYDRSIPAGHRGRWRGSRRRRTDRQSGHLQRSGNLPLVRPALHRRRQLQRRQGGPDASENGNLLYAGAPGIQRRRRVASPG